MPTEQTERTVLTMAEIYRLAETFDPTPDVELIGDEMEDLIAALAEAEYEDACDALALQGDLGFAFADFEDGTLFTH